MVRWAGLIGDFVWSFTLNAGKDVIGGDVDEEGAVCVAGSCEVFGCYHVELFGCFGVVCAGIRLTVGSACRGQLHRQKSGSITVDEHLRSGAVRCELVCFSLRT